MFPAPGTAELLRDVLLEVCQHLEIGEAAPGLLAALQRSLPVTGLAVRRWDAQRSTLETVAVAGEGDTLARVALPTPHRDTLVRWGESRLPYAWHSRGESALSRLLVSEAARGPIAAIPLGSPLCGVLVLQGPLHGELDRLADLAVPFSVALENDQRVHELRRLRETAEGDRAALLRRLDRQDVSEAIVGASTGLAEVMRRVAQVAPTDAPVLILGETGSGKEVVARALHERSRRANGPFLRVNCGAIPTELVDSELFGHEKGAFTGAVAQRKGWFERADGGTLFLDEVAELPSAAQVRLLRVLQDGTVQRVGGQATLQVDVRLVAATHREMGAMVRVGDFRQDLWYRISVFPISLPALRERRDDIAALAETFAARAGVRLFGRPIGVTAADVDRLRGWDWPGNVRELAAVIERAAILGNGHGLDVATALGPVGVPAARGGGGAPAPGTTAAVEPGAGDDPAEIRAALARCLGRIEGPFGAAAALGVNPHTLRARMRRLGIEWGEYRVRG